MSEKACPETAKLVGSPEGDVRADVTNLTAMRVGSSSGARLARPRKSAGLRDWEQGASRTEATPESVPDVGLVEW